MLDSFEVLTTSGVVLWSKTYVPVSSNVINSLIRDVFIQESVPSTTGLGGDQSAAVNPPYKKDRYTLKWTTAREYGIIFVAVYQSLIQLSWIDKLVDNVKTLFTSLYGDQFKKPHNSVIDCPFDEYFNRQVEKLEQALRELPSKPRELAGSDEAVSPGTANDGDRLAPPMPVMRKALQKALVEDITSDEGTPITTPDSSRPVTPNTSVITAKGTPGGKVSRKDRRSARTSAPSSRDISASGKGKVDKSTGKKARRWDDDGLLDDGDDKVLDYSALPDGSKDQAEPLSDTAPEAVDQSSWGRTTKKGEVVLKDLDEEMDSLLSAAQEQKSNASGSASGGLVNSGLGAISGLFRNVVGGKTLTEADLAQPLKAMEDHLVRKNVARDAAAQLTSSVQRDLVGTKSPSFTSIDTAIRSSMDAALSKILTPTSSSSLDLIQDIEKVNIQAKRPYVISIVGVNGVGKSTTLAKIAHLLLHNENCCRVLVAAADTFRSGAVEQLGVHVSRLSKSRPRQESYIELFQRGYGKDAAQIAREAKSYAANPTDGQPRFNVVLIDTAGRRHNDQRLMSSLAPFARAATPDKIFMVGEALVGTDSVAQARHFNESFGQGRGLDGFIVSKCDTVGEMVGTLVSLVWSTRVPVIAVGVGQHYPDLRTFSVPWARKMLLAG